MFRILDVLETLEADMHAAHERRPVLLTEWINWVRKDRTRTEAFIRAMFMLLAVGDVTALHVHRAYVDLLGATNTARRKPMPVRVPTARPTQELL